MEEKNLGYVNIQLDKEKMEILKKIAEKHQRSVRAEIIFVVLEYIEKNKQ